MRRLMIFFSLAMVISLIFFSNTFAQESNINFTHYQADQGLSDNGVNYITQDKEGFIWIATEEGLNRFDGYRFKIYRNDPKDPKSLPGDYVNALCVSRSGTVWVGTSKGLARYNPETDNFTIYRHNPKILKSIGNDKVNAIYEDKFGVLWIGTSKGLNKFDYKTETFVRYYYDLNKQDENIGDEDAVNTIYETKDDSLWVGIETKGLNKYDRDKDSFAKYETNSAGEKIGNVRVLYEDSLGNFWLGCEASGLSRYDSAKNQFIPFKTVTGIDDLSDDSVYAICEDHLGILWIGTTSLGLYKYDPKKNTLANYKYNQFVNTSISSDVIWSMFIDREGILWLGTDLGLNKADLKKQQFTSFTKNPNEKNALSANVVYAFCEDKSGTLWVGTSGGGLNKYDSKTNSFIVYKHNPTSPISLSDNDVYSIYEDISGTLWIGTSEGNLNRYDPKIDGFLSYQSKPKNKKFADAGLTVITQDLDEVFWIGTFGAGLIKYEPKIDKITSYKNDPTNANSLSNNRIFAIYPDKDGIIWIGTQGGGLNKFDSRKNTFTLYKNNPTVSNTLGGNTIMTIYRDSQDTLWIGVNGGGLNKFNPQTESFKSYKNEEGLLGGSVMGILEDSQSNLWLSTNRGLSKFNLRTEEFINYSSSDGLLTDGFNFGAYYKNKKGEMFFGSKGFNRFFPEQIIENKTIPTIAITEFKVFDKPFPKANKILSNLYSQETQSIELSHTENYFSLEFALLSYSNSQKNRYLFKLEGVNEDWIAAPSDRRYISYSNLDYGDYIFFLKGANSDGVWTEKGITLKIKVIAPPWRKWWAYCLYLLTFCIISGVIMRARNKRVKTKQELLEIKLRADAAEIANQAKSAFLANMSHELRTPLNAILGFTQIILRKNQLTEQENDYLKTIMRSGEHLLSLINDVLSISKIEAGKIELNKQTFNLQNFLGDITKIFGSHTVGKGLVFINEIEPGLPEQVEGDEKKLKQVLINLLGNAVKFTSKGKVILRVKYKDSKAFFEVEDTGFGIAKEELEKLFNSFSQTASGQQSKEGTGLGLFISQNLVHLMGGEIKIISELGKGTRFSFNIDLPKTQITNTENSIKKVMGLAKGQKEYRILTVDDRLENRAVLNTLLTSVGFIVSEASNGEQAIRVWQEWQPDLIWMDIRMKIMDGYLATQKIRELEKNLARKTIIIAMTASAFDQDHSKIYSAGCDDIVTKPYLESVIFEKLTQHLGAKFEYQESLPKVDIKSLNLELDSAKIIESLSLIPETLLEQLRKALTQGRLISIEKTIKEIGGYDKSLMLTLQTMIKSYQLEELLHLADQTINSKSLK
ncbi:MAG: response regulator [Acidobacteria bacterium]|nr:response regulator [Acidobacteriota bacterium]